MLAITSIGLAAGMAIALAATRTLESFLFGIAPFDPLTYSTAAAALVLIALAACVVPLRRAASTDPLVLLR